MDGTHRDFHARGHLASSSAAGMWEVGTVRGATSGIYVSLEPVTGLRWQNRNFLNDALVQSHLYPKAVPALGKARGGLTL